MFFFHIKNQVNPFQEVERYTVPYEGPYFGGLMPEALLTLHRPRIDLEHVHHAAGATGPRNFDADIKYVGEF